RHTMPEPIIRDLSPSPRSRSASGRTPAVRAARTLAVRAVGLVTGLLAVLAAVIAVAAPANAATLTQVTSFGSNPGNLSMYVYRPDGVGAGAPLVVALHGCTQNA